MTSKLGLGELDKSLFGGTRWETKGTGRGPDPDQDSGGKQVQEGWWYKASEEVESGGGGYYEGQEAVQANSWLPDLVD